MDRIANIVPKYNNINIATINHNIEAQVIEEIPGEVCIMYVSEIILQDRLEHKVGLEIPCPPCYVEPFRIHVWSETSTNISCPFANIHCSFIPPTT